MKRCFVVNCCPLLSRVTAIGLLSVVSLSCTSLVTTYSHCSLFMNTSKNHLAIVLIIYGFTLPGLEIISNGLKAFGTGHMSFLSFFLTIASGSIYTLVSLPLIADPLYLKSARFFKLSPLLFAFLTLILVKFLFVNEMLSNLTDFGAWCLFLAEITPGFGKRFILLAGLMAPGTLIGQAVDPMANYEIEKPIKSKKE